MQYNGTRPHVGRIRADEQARWFRQRIDGTGGHREISQFEAHSP